MKAFSVTGLVLPSRWIYLFLLSLVLFPFWLLPFGFFNGWAGIISHSACTAQDVVFGELRWCSALFLNAAISGVFHNSAAWCMAPGGESALPSAEGRQSEAPIIFRIYFKLMVCVCVCFSLLDGNVLSDHTQTFAVWQMLFLLWTTRKCFVCKIRNYLIVLL